MQSTSVKSQYTWSEIRKHNKEKDCWIVIDGKVHDVSNYMQKHPGSSILLQRWGGMDASAIFRNLGHSDAAVKIAEKYFIGTVEDLEDSRSEYSIFREIIDRSSKPTEETQKEALKAFQSFQNLILNIKFPCIGAKMAFHRNSYVFRYYDELGSCSALANSCFDLDAFIQVYQHEKWKDNEFFTTLVCAFKKPCTSDSMNALLNCHVNSMMSIINVNLQPGEEGIDFVEFRRKGFFVPGLMDHTHILSVLELPFLVFNATHQFQQLGDDYFKVREIILKRAKVFIELYNNTK